MTVGILEAKLGFNTEEAVGKMNKFQQLMFTVVNNIDNTLSRMEASMGKVGAASMAMSKMTVKGFQNIAVAATAANAAITGGVGKKPYITPTITNKTGSSTIIPPIVKPPVITPEVNPKPAISAISSITTEIQKVSQKFRTFGYLTSAVLTLPIIMAGKAAMNMAKEYEYSMQKIVGLTGVAQSTVDQWSKELLALGPILGKKPQELAEALYFISSSGIKGAEAMNVLELSAKAASSGLGETKDVADLLTSVLNAYAGTGITAQHATDVLVAAVREGKAEASGFSSAMGQIIPIASQMGVSFDQVAGGMAAITLSGSSAATAAVYLKGVFNSLLKAVPGGEKALNSMGTSYEQLRKILKDQGLIALMQKLRDIQMKYGDEMISDVLPNIRALSGFLSIAGKNFKYNSEMMERVENSAGSLGAAWAAVADTIKIRYDKAISSANVSMITLGKSVAEAFLPLLDKLVNKLDEVTKWFDALTETQKRHKLEWIAFIAILGPASLLLSVVGYTISGLISIVGGITKGFIFLTQVIKGVAGSTIAMDAAMAKSAGWTKFVKLLINPWVLLTIAIGAAIIAATNYMKKMQEMPAELQKLKDSFNGIISEESGIKNKIAVVPEMDKRQLEELKNILEQRLQILKDGKIRLDGYRKNSLNDDKAYLKLQEDLAKDQANLEKWQAKPKSLNRTLTINEFTKNVTADKEAITKYLNGFEKSMTIINSKITETESNLKIVQDQLSNFPEDPFLKEQEKQLKLLEQQKIESADIQKVFDNYNDGLKEINRMTQISGGTFDAAGAKLQLYDNIIKALAGTTLPIADKRFQDIIKLFKESGGVFDGSRKDVQKYTDTLDDFNAELSMIDMKKIVMPSFDADTAKLQTYEKELDFVLNNIAEKMQKSKATIASLASIGSFAGVGVNIPSNLLANILDKKGIKDQIQLVNELIIDMDNLKRSIQNTEDEKSLKFLNAQANAFHGVDNQIEVLNYELQRTERLMRAEGEKNGLSVLFMELGDKANYLREKLIELNNTKQLTFLTDMNNAFKDSSSYSDLLSGKIQILKTGLERLSAIPVELRSESWSNSFNSLTDDINKLNTQLQISDILTNSFTDFFTNVTDNFNNFGKFIRGWITSVLKSFQQLAAGLLAKKIVGALMPDITTGVDIAGLTAGVGLEQAKAAALAKSNAMIAASIPLAGAAAAAEGAKSIAIGASIPVMGAAATAANGLAISEAIAAGAWVPFPGNIAAIAAGVSAVTAALVGGIAAVSAIDVGMKAGTAVASHGAVGFADGGVIPPGYPNDTFPAMLSSGEIVIPELKFKKLIEEQNFTDHIDTFKKIKLTTENQINPEKLATLNKKSIPSPISLDKVAPFNKMAQGGIVPSGFSNDTYPTLLSSGEIILNLSELNKLSTKPLGYQKTTSYKKKGTPKPRFADKPSPLEKIRSMIGSMSPFAKGGTVPQGYPNDTFPAMLTSGEIVIPQAKLEQLIKVSNQTEKLDTVNKSVSNKTNILNNKTNPLYKNDLINNIYKSSSDVVNTFNSTKEDLTKKTNVSNNVTNKGNTINNKSEKELIKSFSNVKNLKQNQNWISDAMTSQKNISYFNEISKSNTNIKNIPKMVTGGTVPQGYLNDNYPALLTSGETVIPAPGKLNQNMLNRTPIEFEDVRFVIEENQLVGILKKANVRKSIY